MIDISVIRNKVLVLAMQGKLLEQEIEDEEFVPEDILLTKLAKEEEPYDIPKNWVWLKVKDIILRDVGGGTPSKSIPEYWNGGTIPWVSVKDFSRAESGYLKDTIDHITQEGLDNSASNMVDENAIIICMRMALGKIVRVARPMAINQDLRAIWLKEYVLEDYFVYFYSTLKVKGRGMTVSGIRKDELMNYAFPVPPVREQERIVRKVDDIFKQLNVIEKMQNLYLTNVNLLKNKLIDAGIQGKLTEQLPEDGTAEDLYIEIQAEKVKLIQEGKIKKERAMPEITKDEIPFDIPQNWKWVRLGDISAKISSGNTPAGGNKSNAYVEKGYSFFREQNIYNDGINEEGLVYITEELLKARINSTVLPMDILLNITGGSIGRCALISDDFTKGSINQHILIIRMVDPRLRFYIHACICSPYIQKYIKGNTVGDKEGFSAGRCKNMLIPLPPLAEQIRIVEKIREVISCGQIMHLR